MSKADAVHSIAGFSTEGSFLNTLAGFLNPFGKVADAVGDLLGLGGEGGVCGGVVKNHMWLIISPNRAPLCGVDLTYG